MQNHTYYTPKEKEIFINTFIKQSEGSRIAFDQYIFNFYKIHQVLADGVSKFAPGVPCNKFFKADAVFDTHQKMWDEKNSLLTYFLSDKDFSINSKNLHRLNLVHPDWKYKNSDGMNALSLLAKRGHFDLLKQVAKDFNLDINQKDAQGNHYTRWIFTPQYMYQGQDIDFTIFIKILTRFRRVNSIMSEYPEHLELSFHKIKSISDDWQKSKELAIDLYQKNKDELLTPEGFNLILENWNVVHKNIERILLVKKLEKDIKNNTPDNPKMKI